MALYNNHSVLILILLVQAVFSLPNPLFPKPANVQAIHVLDPGMPTWKYYNSFNSDQWVNFIRERYIEDEHASRFIRLNGNETTESSLLESPTQGPPLYGLWVNIIIISSAEGINNAFSQSSNRSYTGNTHTDFVWSDTSFPVYVVVRKWNFTQDAANDTFTSHYNVFNCSNKKMFINAQVNPSNFQPILIKHIYPKKLKNPKDALRIPLTKCKKISQVRGLLDEINFKLRSPTISSKTTVFDAGVEK